VDSGYAATDNAPVDRAWFVGTPADGFSHAAGVWWGTGFRCREGSYDWLCGPCGELLLEDVTQVDNWRFYANGDAYIDGELAHQCPMGYSRTRLPIVDITKHEQQERKQ